MLRRREGDITFLYPHVREKYDYRRLLFMIYFMDGMKAKIDGAAQSFQYDFSKFQMLKREFMIDWLISDSEKKTQKSRRTARDNMSMPRGTPMSGNCTFCMTCTKSRKPKM